MEIKITEWETALVHGRISPVDEASPLPIGARLRKYAVIHNASFIAVVAGGDGRVQDHRPATERLHRDFDEYHVNPSP